MAGLRGDQVAAMRKDMYKFNKEGMDSIPTMHNKIFSKPKDKIFGAGMKETQRLNIGPLTRHTAENQNIEFKSPKQGWTTYVQYYTYSDGLVFSPEAVEDAVKLGDMLKEYSRDWGEEVPESKEYLAARVFNEGGNLSGDWVFDGSYVGEADPSGELMYDSAPLFNLSGNLRTTKGGQTYYNSVSTAYPASGDILPTHFQTLYNLMTSTNNRSEMGNIKKNRPDTVLTRPGADHQAMQRILTSERLSSSELNDKNPYNGLIKNIWDWDHLTESALYIGKAACRNWQFHDRKIPEIRFFRHEDTGGYKASIRTRFGVYLRFGAWRDWVRGGGTAA